MSREQVAFLSAGVLFGFVVGFVVAWGIGHAPAAPAGGIPRTAPPTMGRGTAPAAEPGGDGMGPITDRLQELKAHIADQPDDVDALVELSSLYMQVSMFAEAREYLERAVELQPDGLHPLTHLGIVLGQLGELPAAREMFERTVELDPDYWQGWFYLAVTTARQGDLEAARRATVRVEALNPGLPEIADIKQHLAEHDAQP